MTHYCWFCNAPLVWQNDYTYEEVHGEGEGIVAYLSCSVCNAEMQCSKLFEELPEN